MNTIKIPWHKLENIFLKYEQEEIPCIIDRFVFDEFQLIIDDFGAFHSLYIYIKNGTKVFDFNVPCINTQGKYDYYKVHVNGDILDFPDPVHREDKKPMFEQNSDLATGIRYLTHYIMNYQRDHKEAHPVPRKYSREHRVSTSNNKVYLLDDIVKYVHDNYVPQGGTHNIQCECWGVRGHYRTYKSGKQVWINAYKKGKKRQEMEPKDKTYYLNKGERV